jgi:hypothetical protein
MKRMLFIFLCSIQIVYAQTPKIWTKEKANEWYAHQPFLTGADFLPSTAINQLEMWQADTFDTTTINRELTWAESLGFNTLRVFLHNLVWQQDAKGLKKRINIFLTIAERHHIKPMFVFFDDCWNPTAAPGKQPEPKPGIHNSGWVRSPVISVHDNPLKWQYLETYVKDILSTFKDDKRILMWDLYNEPGNSGYEFNSFELLNRAFEWAWFVRPSQPITSATWYDNKVFNDFVLENSDVITFHNYNDADNLEKEIIEKIKFGKPLICSEYMARTRNSTFQNCLPIYYP